MVTLALLYFVVVLIVVSVIISKARKRTYLDGYDIIGIFFASLFWLPIGVVMMLAKIGSTLVYVINHPSKR